MPLAKLSFMRFAPLVASQASSLAQRLPKIGFEMGQGVKVIAADRSGDRVNVEAVQRKLRESLRYDEASNKMQAEQSPVDRALHFSVDCASGMAETPGSKRDLGLLADLLRRSGAGQELEAQPLVIDLYPWVKEFLKLYDSAQLANLVLDSFYTEPRLIGRYSAKSVDNSLDLKYIEEKAASLRSIRLGFFNEGTRRSVEARADGVLSVGSSDEDDLEDLISEQRQLLLKHSVG